MPRSLLGPNDHLDLLRQELDTIGATPPEALDAAVAACPGWSVADLLGHHEGVLRFVTAQLRAEPGSDLVPFDPPEDHVDRLDAFVVAADALLAELVATDPDEHRPNWAEQPTSAFWFRRMAQEAAVHRWDVEAAHTTPDPIPTTLALDGVEEFADTFLTFAKRRGIVGEGETVHLHATDEDLADRAEDGSGEWMFTFGAEGVEVEHAHGKGDMAVRGSASDLLLFVWNRRPIEVQTFGEPDPMVWWSSHVTI